MLTPVTAVRFDKRVNSGKTRPCLLGCLRDDGTEVLLVAKFAIGCEMKLRSLVTEALAALLAADLDLPVPEPFLVKFELDFVETIPDAEIKARAQASLGWNFGSKKLPPGFVLYPKDKPLPRSLISTAAEIFAFDTFIANPDRNAANPNLLFNGRELAIIDHELAFFTDGIVGWKAPWEKDALRLPKSFPPQFRHVFRDELRGKALDFSRFKGAFENITAARLNEYRQALPPEWIDDGLAADRILDYIMNLKQNLDVAISRLIEVLR